MSIGEGKWTLSKEKRVREEDTTLHRLRSRERQDIREGRESPTTQSQSTQEGSCDCFLTRNFDCLALCCLQGSSSNSFRYLSRRSIILPFGNFSKHGQTHICLARAGIERCCLKQNIPYNASTSNSIGKFNYDCATEVMRPWWCQGPCCRWGSR